MPPVPGLRASQAVLTEWGSYIRALRAEQGAAIRAGDTTRAGAITHRIFEAERAYADRREEERGAERAERDAEYRSLLDCPMRAESVRGKNERECSRLRLCYMCGDPLGPRGQRWCPRRAKNGEPTCAQRFWRNHGWSWARDEAIRRVRISNASGLIVPCDECGQDSYTEGGPEVNHVIPRVGRGYGDGCHNHQTNLQVLGHRCHVNETNRQAAERRGEMVRLKPPLPDIVPLWEGVA